MLSKNNSISINDVDIDILLENGTKYVAIKPICKAIGINYVTQFEKIKSDEILSSVVPLRGITAGDGKTYKMRVVPLRYVFGWLFTINPKNVKPKIKNQIIKYKLECYDALFDTFSKRTYILKEKADYATQILDLEKKLENNEDVTLLKELRIKLKGTSQRLNSLDKAELSNQLSFFQHQQI